MNLSEKSVALATETSTWLTRNALDIVLASAAGVLVALLLVGLRSLAHRMAQDPTGENHWRTIFARAIAKTSNLFIILCAAELVAENAETPEPLLHFINILFVVAATLQSAVWGRELILGFVHQRVGVADEQSNLGSAVGIIRLLVSITLFAIALIVILDNLGVNVTALVAGLGIGGVAIGLAAQGIFKDLFAALAIIFDKPFRKGDSIRVDQINGTVERIGLKTTRIRSVTGEEVVLSNAALLDKQLHNFARLRQRRVVLAFGIDQQTPPELCARLPEIVRAVVAEHPTAKMVRCGMVGFSQAALNHELQFDVRSSDFEHVFATRAAICNGIFKAFADEGIRLATTAA